MTAVIPSAGGRPAHRKVMLHAFCSFRRQANAKLPRHLEKPSQCARRCATAGQSSLRKPMCHQLLRRAHAYRRGLPHVPRRMVLATRRHEIPHPSARGGQLGGGRRDAPADKYRKVHWRTGIRPCGGQRRHENRTGLVFFQNYWGPGMQGDHIDLWNGSRLTDRGSWLRIHARIGSFGIHSILSDVSDMEKAQAVWFWQLA